MEQLNIYENTLTGRIYFEGNVRKGFTFDVIELQPSGIVQVGIWDETDGYKSQRLAPTNAIFENMDNSLANKTFVILLAVPVSNASKTRRISWTVLVFSCSRINPTLVWWKVTKSLMAIANMKAIVWT